MWVVIKIVGWIITLISGFFTTLGLLQNIFGFTILEIFTIDIYRQWAIFAFIFSSMSISITTQIKLWIFTKQLPKLKIKNYDIEVKTFKIEPNILMAYIEIANEPNHISVNSKAMNVRANIDWHDNLQVNCGRWFYSNRERPYISDLQTVNISPNGEIKKLHFAAIKEKDQKIHAIWRDKDNNLMEDVFHGSPQNLDLAITLKDTKGIEKHLFFNISLIGVYEGKCVDLIQTNKRGKQIGKVKTRCLSELESHIPHRINNPST